MWQSQKVTLNKHKTSSPFGVSALYSGSQKMARPALAYKVKCFWLRASSRLLLVSLHQIMPVHVKVYIRGAHFSVVRLTVSEWTFLLESSPLKGRADRGWASLGGLQRYLTDPSWCFLYWGGWGVFMQIWEFFASQKKCRHNFFSLINWTARGS